MPPGEFDGCAAIDKPNPFLRLLRGEVVEQQVRGAACQSFVQFIDRADFDLDRKSGLPCIFDCLADSARGRDVIVLDQDRVKESHAVVGHAPRRRRRFFETAQARRGLARVEHLAFCSFDHGRRIRAPAWLRRKAAAENSGPPARIRAACARGRGPLRSGRLPRGGRRLCEEESSSSTPPRAS